MATMVSRLLELAEQLIDDGRRSSALRRRAISTAYYAVFHQIAKLCAETLLSGTEQSSDEYARIYRALDHGPLKSSWQNQNSPLRKVDTLKKIGDLIVPLQSERIRADYLPPLPHPFTSREAKEVVQQARRAVDALNELTPDERRMLAIGLLFNKARSS
jgi:hypothetical protein